MDASPAVMKDNSVPLERRSRCRVAARMCGLLDRLIAQYLHRAIYGG
jgi:hypothetical protein